MDYKEYDQIPVVYIPFGVLQKLHFYIHSVDTEISGLGLVRQDGVDFVIEEIFLLKQKSNPSNTIINRDAIAELMISLGPNLSLLRLWWHSHGDGAVFWSPTDRRQIKDFGSGWIVSIVGNTRNEFLARIDTFDPRLTIHMPIRFFSDYSAAQKEELAREVAEKVEFLETPNFLWSKQHDRSILETN